MRFFCFVPFLKEIFYPLNFRLAAVMNLVSVSLEGGTGQGTSLAYSWQDLSEWLSSNKSGNSNGTYPG